MKRLNLDLSGFHNIYVTIFLARQGWCVRILHVQYTSLCGIAIHLARYCYSSKAHVTCFVSRVVTRLMWLFFGSWCNKIKTTLN